MPRPRKSNPTACQLCATAPAALVRPGQVHDLRLCDACARAELPGVLAGAVMAAGVSEANANRFGRVVKDLVRMMLRDVRLETVNHFLRGKGAGVPFADGADLTLSS